jgi:hypothetical protein
MPELASPVRQSVPQGLGTWKRGQHRPDLTGTCHNTDTVTEMVASTGEVHHTIAKKLSLAGHQRKVVRPDQV